MGGYFKWDSGQAEVPPLHATTHQSGGTDPVKLDDLAAPDDNTDLNVSTTKHGLVPKAPNDTTKFLRGDGTWVQIIIPVPLTTRATSTLWDGDLYPTTSKTLIDLSAVFGVPAGIRMVSFRYTIYDSGSAATDCILIIGPDGASGVGLQVNCERVDSAPRRGQLIVPCNTDGDVYFQCVASGGATATLSIRLEIWIYWI